MAHDEPVWLPHNGQGAPDLPPGTRVQVRFRDGMGENWSTAESFEYWSPSNDDKDPRDYWLHSDNDESRWQDDIIAYRVVDEQ